jgi:hypothetical protein
MIKSETSVDLSVCFVGDCKTLLEKLLKLGYFA